jgi:plasmid stabilization system protein ParE
MKKWAAASVRHIRILLFGHYRIAYLIKPDGNIDILGVFHGALEIERYFL